jgi:two-component system chemotaxis response regulator CheB
VNVPVPVPAVRVLVVDDSSSCRELLVGLISSHPGLVVVGTASDGEEAVREAARLKPDVITMDIHLPRLDGFAATRRIMETCPTRIVMVTASSIPHEVAASFTALESGALTVLAKPPGPGHPLFEPTRDDLLRTVALMAEVAVVRRWPAAGARTAPPPVAVSPLRGAIALVAIGASTGGPLALQALLSRLRPGFSAPIVIVQHISLGFADGLVQWLGSSTGYAVRVAAHAAALQPGVAYVAPDGFHTQVDASGRIVLDGGPKDHGFRPSVASLFRSAAQAFGPRAIGVLLTGMGHDGARELKAMRDAGAITLVQDADSAVINGMPGEAVRLGAATHVLPPETMAATLNRLVQS